MQLNRKTIFASLLLACLAGSAAVGTASADTLIDGNLTNGMDEIVKSKGPVILLFKSDFCHDCSRVEALLKKYAVHYPRFKFVTWNSGAVPPETEGLYPQIMLRTPEVGEVYLRTNFHPDDAAMRQFLNDRTIYLETRANLLATLSAARASMQDKTVPVVGSLDLISESKAAIKKLDNDERLKGFDESQ